MTLMMMMMTTMTASVTAAAAAAAATATVLFVASLRIADAAIGNSLHYCKCIRVSTDILRRVFRILTEPVPYTFVSVNWRNNEARAHVARWARATLFRRFADANVVRYRFRKKHGKLATKYPWICGYFFTVCRSHCITFPNMSANKYRFYYRCRSSGN